MFCVLIRLGGSLRFFPIYVFTYSQYIKVRKPTPFLYHSSLIIKSFDSIKTRGFSPDLCHSFLCPLWVGLVLKYRSSIPGRVIPKTQKMVLSIIRYGSKVKWSNQGKGVTPSATPWSFSYCKGVFWSPSITVANFTFTYIFADFPNSFFQSVSLRWVDALVILFEPDNWTVNRILNGSSILVIKGASVDYDIQTCFLGQMLN